MSSASLTFEGFVGMITNPDLIQLLWRVFVTKDIWEEKLKYLIYLIENAGFIKDNINNVNETPSTTSCDEYM